MGFFTLLVIALGLSFDSFAVSVSSGMVKSRITLPSATVIAFSLAFFQGGMTVIGWLAGNRISSLVAEFDHWLAFGLLGVLGTKMILTSNKSGISTSPPDPLKPAVLFSLSLATSIDALIVGISFAFFEIRILIAGFLIGSVTFVASMIGILFGKKAGLRFGGKMEILGGLILIAIGTKILIEHLFFA